MKFTNSIAMFNIADIPAIGNFETGVIVGLTSSGAELCKRLFAEDVAKEDLLKSDHALVTHLIRGGFFTNQACSRGIDSAYLHITNRCNLACKGCYSSDCTRNHLEDPSIDTWEHVLLELADCGVKRLIISGGEPFLHKGLPEIVLYAKEHCRIQSITVLSNGLRISQKTLKRLAGHIDCVSVSFDGRSSKAPALIRGEQNFNRLVSAVRKIKDAGIHAHIIATIHAQNTDDLRGYLELSQQLGATINFSLFSLCSANSPDRDLVPSDDDLRELGRQLFSLNNNRKAPAAFKDSGPSLSMKHYCGAAKSTVSIAADGTIYPCHMLHMEEYAMGNAFHESISKALSSDVAKAIQALRTSRFDGCGSCTHRHLCGGGCRARSLSTSPTLLSRDPYCALMTEFYNLLDSKISSSFRAESTSRQN